MSESKNQSGYFVGVAVGPAKIRAGVFDPSHRLFAAIKMSTKAERGTKAVVERIARCVRDTVDEADLTLKDVRGVGVGAPGTVNGETGTVISAPALNWQQVRLQQQLADLLGVPVFVENDSHLATLGVHMVEFKSTPRRLLGIFIGTSIGGGMIVDGNLLRGSFSEGSELGHMPLRRDGPACGCGKRGCFEAVASRTAMVQRIKEAIKDGQKTVLTERSQNLDKLRSKDLRKALRRGDDLARRVVGEAARDIGLAVAELVQTQTPQVVVLGGDVMEALANEMLETIVETARRSIAPSAMNGVEIVASVLGDNAGITGGAVLARRLTEKAAPHNPREGPVGLLSIH